jgi:hypothetical protein
MSIRQEVREFVRKGPLPDSRSASVEHLRELQEALEAITGPVTDDEAALLMTAFGPDDCFGLAWVLLHLIETAPGGAPITEDPGPDANEWVRRMWNSIQFAKQLKQRRN